MRLAVGVVAVAALAGCGSGGGAMPQTTATQSTQGRVTDAQIRHDLELPGRVPLRAAERARPADVHVVRTWLDRLRHGDVTGAAALFAVPSRFQNISSIQIIHSRHDAELINRSLPCGARLLSAGGASGFVVYRARLTDRPGGACGSGTGQPVRGAILVRHGLIAEWYRLPDRDVTRSGQPPITGPQV